MPERDPWPMKDTQLTQTHHETAKGLWLVYAIMTLGCVLVFKAVAWAGSTPLSCVLDPEPWRILLPTMRAFGYFNSPAIEAVAIFFMLIGGINFGTHFLAFRKLSFSSVPERPRGGRLRRLAGGLGARSRLFPAGQSRLSVLLDGAAP